MKNIVIFGASKYGEKVFNYFKDKENIKINYFCDNNQDKQHNQFLGINVIPPNELLNIDIDEIVIASSYESEIKEQLLKLGIDQNKISIFSTNIDNIQFKNNSDLLLISETLMFDISNALIENNINYHIDHGTLLGLIRDNRILPWDIDIDLAIEETELKKVINLLDNFLVNYTNKYCAVNNWEYFVCYTKKDHKNHTQDIAYITVVNNVEDKNSTIGLDIHVKYTHNGNIVWTLAERKLSATKSYCFPTIDFTFKTKTLKIPNDSSSYLTELYGEWKTPVKEWDYSKYSNICDVIEYSQEGN